MTIDAWHAQYDPGIPRSLAPYPPVTLVDLLQENARLRPAHPALRFNGST